MKPSLFGCPSWYVLWTAAGLVGIAMNAASLRRQGIDLLRVLLLLLALPLATLFGAKALYIAENGMHVTQGWSYGGYRGPGGLVAVALTLVSLCWLLSIPVRRTLDAMAPSFLVVIAIGRIGCFLQGCCFGTPTDLPWALAFPAGSPAYVSQEVQHLIPQSLPQSLPVHPLSLYFSVDALAILAFLVWLRPRASYPGQIFLWFGVLHFWSKATLETLRGFNVGSAMNRSGEAGLWIALVASATLLAVTSVRALKRRDVPIQVSRTLP